MALVVQKYGGSSVSDADRIRRVAERIVETKKAGNDVVVVVSAMGDTTDDLLDLARQVNPAPPPREMDMLLTSGGSGSPTHWWPWRSPHSARRRAPSPGRRPASSPPARTQRKIIDVTPGRLRSALDEG